MSNPAWGQIATGYPKLVPITCSTDPTPKRSDAGEFLADALATLKLTPTQAVMTFQGKGHVESGKCYRFDILLASCGYMDAQIRSFRIPACTPFDGFLPPIAAKDENLLATSTATIPVKWSLMSNPAWGQIATGYPKLVPITCSTDPTPKRSDAGEFLADALATLKLTPTQAVMTFQGKGHVESGKCYRFDILLASCGYMDAQIRSFRIRVK
ncbi:hypothetical protein HXX76_012369 [Chlamydomonas incerta]|uniref:Uncharacterized protein n=1 Tax=Chlamydomonas incerta TaxID=51695 RepID=A0A835SHU9_CHLIN|nr:hypothetical protein HXX76_012369 [Chlamydomonas incerta]|eukprot:KAG2427433.1 hypothetical protein HXX76_012369 [Chlamydomonas incerta]